MLRAGIALSVTLLAIRARMIRPLVAADLTACRCATPTPSGPPCVGAIHQFQLVEVIRNDTNAKTNEINVVTATIEKQIMICEAASVIASTRLICPGYKPLATRVIKEITPNVDSRTVARDSKRKETISPVKVCETGRHQKHGIDTIVSEANSADTNSCFQQQLLAIENGNNIELRRGTISISLGKFYL